MHVGRCRRTQHRGRNGRIQSPRTVARCGRGSEVLGFDDQMSTDHDWKPRVLLFPREADHALLGEAVGAALADQLPPRFRDQQTDYAILTLRGFLREHLDLDIDAEIEARDWLTLPEQRLRMVTAGAVYHDDVGLHAVRDRLAYHPHDVWLYLLVAGWWRIHPEANLVGRVGAVGTSSDRRSWVAGWCSS
jgi:hypothetical protein